MNLRLRREKKVKRGLRFIFFNCYKDDAKGKNEERVLNLVFETFPGQCSVKIFTVS